MTIVPLGLLLAAPPEREVLPGLTTHSSATSRRRT